MSKRDNTYTSVTHRIVQQLEQGVRPWMKPWNAAHTASRITRPLRSNGVPYNGINILILWDATERQGFANPTWLTFRQAKELGGNIRKGQRSTPIVFASKLKPKPDDEASDSVECGLFLLKQYAVFNVDQCDGLPELFYQLPCDTPAGIEPIARTSEFVCHTGAQIHVGGNQACYVPSKDVIRMPHIDAFVDRESHAATLAHELTHWTGHQSRLDRNLGRKKWGDEGYALEELVAELGSAFLCADLGITPEIREDHSSYIQSWLKVLRRDERAVFQMASLACKAADYLHSLQPDQQQTPCMAI